jgi:ribokinase
VTTVLVVGDIATDVLAALASPLANGTALATGTDTRAAITLTPGGSAANTAAWLAATAQPPARPAAPSATTPEALGPAATPEAPEAGLRVVLVSSVGDDGAATARLAELAAAGVECRVRHHPGVATGAVIVLSDPGERTMLCDRGANRLLAPDQIDETLDLLARPGQPGATHLHLSAYPLFDESSRPAARHALAAARAAGLTTSLDAASAGPLAEVGARAFLEWTAGTDLLIANLDEARVLAGPAAGTAGSEPEAMAIGLGQAGRFRHVVVKLGAAGAVWAESGRAPRAHRCPAEEVTAVDPTGAGDAFAAGLLAAWLGGTEPAAAIRAGAALGARAVTTVGARPTSG